MPQVRATARAQQQIAAMNRRDRPQFDAFVIDVGRHGCNALTYRLSGATPINHVCIKHLRADLRVAVAFESADLAWILLVGPHTNDPALDIYAELYRIIGMEPEPDAGRNQPPCCDEHGQAPPVLGDLAEAILANAQQLRRTRTRRERT